MLKCTFCSKECKNNNSLRNHERCCPHNPNRNYKNGMLGKKAWNAGLTKDICPNLSGGKGSFKGKTHSSESKAKISKKLTINNKGGRSKWYEVSGQKVQGTWERDLALKFDELEIQWEKLKTNSHTFKYKINEDTRRYTPDFYLKDYDLYLEVKGFWWGNDKLKMDAVLKQNPTLDKKLLIIEKEKYEIILNAVVADVVLALS